VFSNEIFVSVIFFFCVVGEHDVIFAKLDNQLKNKNRSKKLDPESKCKGYSFTNNF
jgi:hypothetical protein